MRIPSPLLAANYVLATVAICAAIFALGLWFFVLKSNQYNPTLVTVEDDDITVTNSPLHTMEDFFDTDGMASKMVASRAENQLIRQMEQPIKLDEYGMAPMDDGTKMVEEVPFRRILVKPLCANRSSNDAEEQQQQQQSTLC
ncbi:hypothetical protein niasHT_024627 [Heterodera trifolii]|uniref:Uncharacterized protein n=1 Tax=Heterodera trifolii TaxID=157864 RepID=A0ABD2K7K0_9BILA